MTNPTAPSALAAPGFRQSDADRGVLLPRLPGPTEEVRLRSLVALKRHGGRLTNCEALRDGITIRTLEALADEGRIEEPEEGVWQLVGLEAQGDSDLVEVARWLPDGVICLGSALVHHRLVDEIPDEVHVAIARGKQPARPCAVPVRVFRFSGPAWREGVEDTEIDGEALRVTTVEKSITDAFKFRAKTGEHLAVSAMRRALQRGLTTPDAIHPMARVCRVERVMAPYFTAFATL